MQRHGSPSEQAYLFPSHASATRCVSFLRLQQLKEVEKVKIVDLYPNDGHQSIVSAVLVLNHHLQVVKSFWQHTGEGISSRRAEYCFKAFNSGSLGVRDVPNPSAWRESKRSPLHKGPKRYQKSASVDEVTLSPECSTSLAPVLDGKDHTLFVEERFGRNLDMSLANSAKLAVRKRIATALDTKSDLMDSSQSCSQRQPRIMIDSVSEDDVYLYPCGMNSIFHTHQLLMACRGQMRSVSYG